jgi:hypothetical protein
MGIGGTESLADELAICAGATLAAPSARLGYLQDIRTSWTDPDGREVPPPTPGAVGQLVRRLFNAARERFIPGVEFGHLEGDGFIEPSAGRYMIDFGSYAQVFADGKLFSGLAGRALESLRPVDRLSDPLELLSLIRMFATGAEAYLDGAERVRGTSCRKYSVHVEGESALTACVDGEHVRRIRLSETASSEPVRGPVKLTVTKERTIDLWDFGVSLENLDWSQLPDFSTPR